MSAIELKSLDFGKARGWVKQAKHRSGEDIVYAFISTWVGFNYYYGTFGSSREPEFAEWTKKNCSGRVGDRSQWTFLVQHPDFEEVVQAFRSARPDVLANRIRLPVFDVISRRPVPDVTEREVSLGELGTRDIFSVLYQVRCNLFHGHKDPQRVERDRELCTVSAAFLVPFCMSLLDGTLGEEKSAYSPFSWD